MKKLYRYVVDYYCVPNDQVNKTMPEIMGEIPVYKHEFLTTFYQPMDALKSDIPAPVEGCKWINHKMTREDLDVYDKNLEFCERAELSFRGIDKKYPDLWDYLYWVVDNLIREEFEETLKAIKERNIEQVIDGACDIQVLAANLPYKLLRKLLHQSPSTARKNTKKAFNLVVDSNMRKLDDNYTAEFRPDGKVLKPTGWIAPNFNEIISEE